MGAMRERNARSWKRCLQCPSCVCLGNAFQSMKILQILCGNFDNQRRLQFEGCVAEPPQTITAILFGSKWNYFFLRIVLQDTLGEVMKSCPPGLYRSLHGKRNKRVCRHWAMRREVWEKGLKLSLTEEKRGKEEQSHCAMQPFGTEVSGMQQKKRSRTCNQCGNISSGLENEIVAAGSKGESEKEQV